MKRLIIFLAVLMPLLLSANVITSKNTGGIWTSASTWVGGSAPSSTDTAIIATTAGYSVTANTVTISKVTVNSGATLTGELTITAILVNNGTIATSTHFTFTLNSGTVITGSGSWAGGNMGLFFQGTSQVIDASAHIVAGNIELYTTSLGGPVKVRNKGSVILNENTLGKITNQGSTYSSVWINDTNAYVKVLNASWTNSKDTLYANAPGNTIEYGGNASYTIKNPKNSTYYNLTTSDTNTAKLPAALTVTNNLKISYGTLDVTTSNYGLTIGGNFTDNGTFTQRSGTVTFNGSANQQLNGSNTPTFYNFTENQSGATTDSLFLNAALTVSNTLTTTSGILDCKKHQLTNSSTPVVSISPSSASICYGDSTTLTASGYTSYIWFPSTGLRTTATSSVSAGPFANTTYTVYGNNSHTYTCGVGTDAITLNSCGAGNSCANAVSVSQYPFDSIQHFSIAGKQNMWFKFTADSTITIIEIVKLSTRMTDIKAITLDSGTCSSLYQLYTDTIKNGSDTMPGMMPQNLVKGKTYYIQVSRYACGDVDTNFGLIIQGMRRPHIIPRCSTTCGPNLIKDGDFETPVSDPSNGTGNNPYFIGANSHMRKTANIYGTNSPRCNYMYNSYDCTNGYAIARADSDTLLLPVNWDWGASGYDHTYYKYDVGHYFYGDSPSSADTAEKPVSPWTVMAWQQSVRVVPGATYRISFYNKAAALTQEPNPARAASLDAGLYAYVNAPAPTAPWSLPPASTLPYIMCYADSDWTQVCGLWTANDTNTVANIQIYDMGNVAASPFDFGLDDIEFYIFQYDTLSVTATPSLTICNSTTLTVYPTAAQYVWSPATGLSATTGSTVIATPTVTTTYTVKYRSADSIPCTNDSILVTVIFEPTIPVTVVPDSIHLCAGASATLTASGATTYAWQPSTGLSATTGSVVDATPTSSTTYTVTGTSSAGCNTATAVVTYDASCCAANCAATATSNTGTTNYPGGLNITTNLTSAYGTGPLTFSGSCGSSSLSNSVSLSGILTLTQKTTFRNVNVAMGTYAKIVVDSLDTLIVNHSRLYACDTMWDGILVKPGGTVIIDSNSVVEDALIGIEAKSGPVKPAYVTIVHSLMNNNATGLQIDPYALSGTYPLVLQADTFTTKAEAFSPNPYLKVPYSGDIGNYNIALDTVKGTTFGQEAITIGDHNSSAYLNHFSNVTFGIFAINSNFAVFNNYFSDMEGHTTSSISPIGVGVFATSTNYDTTNVATYFTAIVGSSGTNYGNTFYNVCRGVNAIDYVHLQVDSNYFYTPNDNKNSHGVYPYGDHAVYFKTQGHDSIWFALDNNTIENFNTGIHCIGSTPTGFTNYPNGATNPASYINTNYIHASSTNQLSFGIQVENFWAPISQWPKYNLYIQNNTIDSANYCIYLNELTNSYTFVDNNADLYVMPSASTDITLKAGVYLSDCDTRVYVSDNSKIHADGTYIGAAARADSNVVGIFAYLSLAPTICGNTTYKLGQDIKFEGSCTYSIFTNNTLDSAYDGLVLDMNGVFSQQGAAGVPAGDGWDTWTKFYNSQTYSYSSNAVNSPLYLTTLPIINGTTGLALTNFTSGSSLFSTTGTSVSCSAFAPSTQDPHPLHGKASASGIDTTAMVNQMKTIIGDSLGNGYTMQSEYIMKQQVYEMLGNDPSLQNKDTALAGFYNRNNNTNIGYISLTEQQIRIGNIAGARNTNSLIIPQNQIEQNHKDVNTVVLATYGSSIDSANSNQITTLQNIATQCPVLGGTAVFKARALLNALLNTSTVYTDSCSDGRPGHSRTEKSITVPMPFAKVYPNPANTLLNIQVQLPQGSTDNICLYNSVGERVICNTLSSNVTTISTSNLAAGIYYYRISDQSGNLIKADKVMIIR